MGSWNFLISFFLYVCSILVPTPIELWGHSTYLITRVRPGLTRLVSVIGTQHAWKVEHWKVTIWDMSNSHPWSYTCSTGPVCIPSQDVTARKIVPLNYDTYRLTGIDKILRKEDEISKKWIQGGQNQWTKLIRRGSGERRNEPFDGRACDDDRDLKLILWERKGLIWWIELCAEWKGHRDYKKHTY